MQVKDDHWKLWGRGFSKTKAFKRKYEVRLEFPEGWEDQIKFSVGVE